MDVTLTNKGERRQVECAATDGEIVVTLAWKPQEPGFIGRLLNRDVVDLDLGCYYRLRDGRRGVIDALQFADGNGGPRHKSTAQGCYLYMPYIWHTGDRSGNSGTIEERILINPEGLSKISTVMLYMFIYDGEALWSQTRAWLKVQVPGCDEIVMDMNEQENVKKFCLAARIDIDDERRVTVTRMDEYYNTHSECGAAHGWDLAFKPNRK